MDKTVQVSVYIPADLFQKLKTVADADDRAVNYMVLQAVSDLIAKPVNVVKWSRNRGPGVGQVHIEDAISAAVKRGPLKVAKHK
jgi:predicted transcriptional regulator